MSERLEYKLESLNQLDLGIVAEQHANLVQRGVDDCRSRHRVLKPRRIALIIELTPSEHDDSEINVVHKMKIALPDFSSKEYTLQANRLNQLSFNNDTPDGRADMWEGKEKSGNAE